MRWRRGPLRLHGGGAAGDEQSGKDDGKRAAARYFFSYELPRIGPQLDLLESLDRTTIEMRDAWF